MNRSTLSLLLTAIALLIILGLCALIIIGAPHLLSVPRQYLFRTAIINTICLAISVTVVVSLLGSLGARLAPRAPRGRQIVQLVLLAGLSIVLLVPNVTVAARRLLQSTGLLDSPLGGLSAIGGYYVLILLPLFHPLLTSPNLGEGLLWSDQSVGTSGQNDDPVTVSSPIWGGLRWGKNIANQSTLLYASISLLFTLLNPITPLLLTSGEPLNRTYLWAGWAFHAAYVSRNYAQAAAMILWMLPLIVIAGLIMWLGVQRRAI